MVGGGWQIFFFDFDQNRSLEREDGGLRGGVGFWITSEQKLAMCVAKNGCVLCGWGERKNGLGMGGGGEREGSWMEWYG